MRRMGDHQSSAASGGSSSRDRKGQRRTPCAAGCTFPKLGSEGGGRGWGLGVGKPPGQIPVHSGKDSRRSSQSPESVSQLMTLEEPPGEQHCDPCCRAFALLLPIPALPGPLRGLMQKHSLLLFCSHVL